MELATYIKEMRIENEMTQGQLARKLGYVNGQFVSNWERDYSYPPPAVLNKLCKVLLLDKKKVFKLSLKRSEDILRKALSI